AAKKSNVQLGVIFQDRMKPHIRQLKSWLDQGLLGRPIIVDARVKWYRPPEYYSNSRWRGTFALDGGGALINQGIHTVDLLLWLLGNVVRVQARTGTLLHKIEAEDTAAAILEFSSGALGILHATTAAYPPRRKTSRPRRHRLKNASQPLRYIFSLFPYPCVVRGENHFPRIVHKVLNFEKYQTLGKQKMSMT